MTKFHKRALIQFSDGEHHQKMLEFTREIHEKYCMRHSIDFLNVHEYLDDGRSKHWRKISLMLEAANNGYEQFAWLDADCVIVNNDFDFMSAAGFGISVCECFDSPTIERHLNTGVIICMNLPEVRHFLSIWNQTPRIGTSWQDQSAFIHLMRSRPHRDLLTVLPNRFNAVETHMEARDPFIRHFAGDADRLSKIEALTARLHG